MEAHYRYPLYPWRREWSQYYIYQWHLVEHGPPYYLNYRFGPADVRKTLQQIARIDRVTRGIPKVVLLCGWQRFVQGKVTWDTQFPSFVTVDGKFADPSIGPGAADAIRWLMAEAKQYNTMVSFHLDFGLAQEHSPLWRKYADLDLLCKDENGEIITFSHWEGRVNLQREFDAGLFQERMADFFETFPEVLDTGLVHNDWNITRADPGHGTTEREDVAALKRCMAWIKDTYGVDTMCELLLGSCHDYGYGMQCAALTFNFGNPPYYLDGMKVPAYIMCGGRGVRQADYYHPPGALYIPAEALLFGASNQGEYGFRYTNDENDPEYANNLFRDFCYSTLPWYYLNRLLRLSYDPGAKAVMFSEGVRSFIESGGVGITKNGCYIRQGNDIFIPALWKASREIIAWSDDGYENKRWKLPDSWSGVTAVDLYNNTLEGLTPRAKSVAVHPGGYLCLTLSAKDGAIIVPAGAGPDDSGETAPPSGEAEFIRRDHETQGSWIGRYGSGGYLIPAYACRLPAYAAVIMTGGEDSILADGTDDPRALQKTGDPIKRVAVKREAALHEIIDVNIGNNTKFLTLYLLDWEGLDCQVALDVIDSGSIQRLGAGTTQIVSRYTGGVYITYKVTGRVRFRITRFHFDQFGRNDGNNEAGPPSFSGLFFDDALT